MKVKRLLLPLVMVIVMMAMCPMRMWAASTHYDAGYASSSWSSSTGDGGYLILKLSTMRIWNYQGDNSHFATDPKVTVTVDGVGTHTLYLNSLYTISDSGEGDENPFKNSGTKDFANSKTYDKTSNNVRVAAYFKNHQFEQTVSGTNNGGGNNKWCTADLYIHVYTFRKTSVSISGSWRDQSGGVNTNESVSWSFNGGYPYVKTIATKRSTTNTDGVEVSWTTNENSGTWEVWRGNTFLAACNGTTKSYTDRNRCGETGATYHVTYRPNSSQNSSPTYYKGLYQSSAITLSHDYTNYVYNNDATGLKDGTCTRHCQYCNAADTKTDTNHPKWTYSVSTQDSKYGTVSGSLASDGVTYTVTATPKSGYFFKSWAGARDNVNNPLVYTMTGNTALTAFFYTSLTLNVNDTKMGSVSGGGNKIECGSRITPKATPNEGYHFVKWSDGSTYATHATFDLTAPTTLTATFAPNQYIIATASNNDSWGSVSGAGVYDYQSQHELTATAARGYQFVKWEDNSTANPRTITVPLDGATYTATFAISQFTITAKTNNAEYGTVTGGGTYVINTQHVLTATPASNLCRFKQWSDGITDNPRTITVEDNAIYTAEFEYALTISNNVLTRCEKWITGDVVIPASVTSIGNNAFFICRDIQSIIIPSSVVSIGKQAFYCCDSLTSVTIEYATQQIKWGNYMFGTNQSSMTLKVPSTLVSSYKAATGWKNFGKITCISHSLEHVPAVNATCTTAGNIAHYHCDYCGDYSDQAGTNSVDATIAALGHGQTNGYTPTYTWSDDINTHTCSFTLKCKDCNTEVVSNQELTGSQTDHADAACTAAGSTTYQVTGSYSAQGSKAYREDKTKTYTIPATGKHSFENGVCTVCHTAPLCFTAEEDNATVTLTKYGTPAAISLVYSTDDGATWSEYSIDTPILLAHTGDKLYLCAKDVNETFNDNYWSYYHFTLNKKVSASGDATTLLNVQGTLKVPEYAFSHLFDGCSSLTTAPDLPATTLANNCYYSMFSRCSSLTTAPELPATTLADKCYRYMFDGCSSLSSVTVNFTYWNTEGLSASNWLKDVASTGTFVCPEGLDVTATSSGNRYVPEGWTVKRLCTGAHTLVHHEAKDATCVEAGNAEYWECQQCGFLFSDAEGKNKTTLQAVTIPATYQHNIVNGVCTVCHLDMSKVLCFTAEEDNASVTLKKKGTPATISLIYSTDNGATWSEYSVDTDIPLAHTGDKLYLCASDVNETFNDNRSYYYFTLNKKVAASGDVTTLLNRLGTLEVPEYAFSHLFHGCSSLTTAPDLPATTLAVGCYQFMFSSCSSLTTAPDLPVTTLAVGCYQFMFSGCSSLTTAPDLPATTLAGNCYDSMFAACSSLTTAPDLPATTLANHCYATMFYDCSSLTTAPDLPATTLADYCYDQMFYGCSSLSSVTVNFTYWNTEGSSAYYWLVDVATTGTFICPEGLDVTATDKRSIRYVPEGWTVKRLTKGDVNVDGKTSIADIPALVEILRGRATDAFGTADVDGNGSITIDDVNALSNKILGK